MNGRRLLMLGLASCVASAVAWPYRALALRDTPPPPMALRASGGGVQAGGIGTYCWGDQCVDMMGTPYPRCPLVVTEDEALAFDFANIGHPRRLSYTVWACTVEDQLRRPVPAGGYYAEPVRDEVLVFPVSPAPLLNDLPPGLYVIDVFTRVRRGGDTQQGFKLLVQPARESATPVASPAAPPLAAALSTCAEPGG